MFLWFRYEETYFTRLPVTRQDRHKSRLQHSSKALANELAGTFDSEIRGKRKNKSGMGGKKKGTTSFIIFLLLFLK